jgi:hypothetical protein
MTMLFASICSLPASSHAVPFHITKRGIGCGPEHLVVDHRRSAASREWLKPTSLPPLRR